MTNLTQMIALRQRFYVAMSQAEVAEVDMTSKRFVTLEEAQELVSQGYQIFACNNNSAVRFLRREGVPDLLFYT